MGASESHSGTVIQISRRDILTWIALPLVAAMLVGGAVYLVSRSQPAAYRSTARLALSSFAADGRPLGTAEAARLIATQSEALQSQLVIDPAAVALGLSPKAVADRLTVVTSADDDVIRLSFRSRSSLGSQAALEAIIESYGDYATEALPSVDVQLLDAPDRPSSPAAPRPLRDAGIAAAGALVLFLAINLIRDRVRFVSSRRTDTPSD